MPHREAWVSHSWNAKHEFVCHTVHSMSSQGVTPTCPQSGMQSLQSVLIWLACSLISNYFFSFDVFSRTLQLVHNTLLSAYQLYLIHVH
jgi:hypothetical protein